MNLFASLSEGGVAAFAVTEGVPPFSGGYGIRPYGLALWDGPSRTPVPTVGAVRRSVEDAGPYGLAL